MDTITTILQVACITFCFIRINRVEKSLYESQMNVRKLISIIELYMNRTDVIEKNLSILKQIISQELSNSTERQFTIYRQKDKKL